MSEWCEICCTTHLPSHRCPGDLQATEDERHGWRVNVETPQGIEGYGVLVAPTSGPWRARILTYPNILWLVPGGRATIKFVGDTARGILLAGTSDRALGETLNLGSGREIAIGDLAKIVGKVVDRPDPVVEQIEPRPGDVLRLCADSTRARDVLGYAPAVDFEEGLTKLLAWYLEKSWEKPIPTTWPSDIPAGEEAWKVELDHLKRSIAWSKENLSHLLSE